MHVVGKLLCGEAHVVSYDYIDKEKNGFEVIKQEDMIIGTDRLLEV